MDGYGAGQLYPQPISVQDMDLTLVLTFFWIYSKLFGDVRLVEEDVPIDYEDVYNDFVNPKMMCRLDQNNGRGRRKRGESRK